MSTKLDIVPRGERLRSEASEQAAEILREWLRYAEAGEIEDLVIVGARYLNGTLVCTRGYTQTPDRYRRLGMLESVKQRLIIAELDPDEEVPE